MININRLQIKEIIAIIFLFSCLRIIENNFILYTLFILQIQIFCCFFKTKYILINLTLFKL